MSERLVCLRPGLFVPLSAVEAVFAIERAGHRLRLDGDDMLIDLSGPLDPHDFEELKMWKRQALLAIEFTTADGVRGASFNSHTGSR